MNCFPCFKPKHSHSSDKEHVPVAQTRDHAPPSPQPQLRPRPQTSPVQSPKPNSPKPTVVCNNNKKNDANADDQGNNSAKTFTFRELATATKNFRKECLLGEDGFGRLYKGTLPPSGQVVAVKQLDKNSMQGNKEFLVEILMLSLLHHPNLVNMIGYCADGDQRLLVYDYLPMGSVETYLFDITPDKKPLDWVTRMKIASGIAKGLQYLHEKANPPVIYRNLKLSNVLLDEEFNPKLFDYGLAKLGGNNTHLTPRVMGNNGYCAPEYERHGELTVKSDVYSFGVVLLELITGRRALDASKPAAEQNLVTWAQPFFRDPKRFPEMVDPVLGNEFPVTSLNQAVGVAAMCIQAEPDVRPLAIDVLAALTFLTVASPSEPVRSTPPPAPSPQSEESTDQPVPRTPPSPTPKSDLENGDRDLEGQTVPTSPPAPIPSIDRHSGDKSNIKDEESNNNHHDKDQKGIDGQHVQKDKDQVGIGGLNCESDSSSVISDSDEEGCPQGKSQSIKCGSSLGLKSKTHLDIGSMSSSSISSIDDDDESERGSLDQTGNNNNNIVIKHGTSTSLKMKRRSTKKHERAARSRSERIPKENSQRGGLGSSS